MTARATSRRITATTARPINDAYSGMRLLSLLGVTPHMRLVTFLEVSDSLTEHDVWMHAVARSLKVLSVQRQVVLASAQVDLAMAVLKQVSW